MCVVCGCASPDPHHAHGHSHEHGHDTRHGHAHTHEHAHPGHDHGHEHATHAVGSVGAEGVAVDPATGDLHYGAGSARVSVPGMSQARAIKLEADVLGANKRVAEQNRAHFASHGVVAYNLVSSPGSGKTTLLCATIEALKARAATLPVAVIEGDQQTSHDADRIRATGAPAIQINTGKGCHLDAPMVAEAFGRLDLHGHAHEHQHAHDHDHGHEHHHGPGSLLFIENVGNLVCPAMWDLGERAKIAILSVTEGEDKPLKYPDMFAAAQLMVLNKTDLLPHLDFDVAQCIEYARRVNPGIEVLLLSAKTGAGMDAWLDWLLQPAQPAVVPPAQSELARLQARVAELEAQLAARAGAQA
jgi:hydrogenase nickel incorporation protein HypB